jgi:hypothetical protein
VAAVPGSWRHSSTRTMPGSTRSGAVEERCQLLAAAVGDLVLNHPVGDAHETVVLAGAGDRVQQREQGDRDRLGEVEKLAGPVEDLLGVAHVGVDVLGGA